MAMTKASGWGRAGASLCESAAVRPGQESEAIEGAGPRGVLGRGAGCSYGDAALNTGGHLLDVPRGIATDLQAGTVTAAAGTTFEQLLAHCLPHGWSLPVLPGTRHLTLGGAIAADVHGKNHWTDGSIGAWLDELVLVDGTGTRRVLHPEDDAFWATVGGMGLTGLIVSATVRLVPVESTWLEVDNRRCDDLDAVLVELDDAVRAERWAVAWVDGLARGPQRGRGVVSRARVLPAARVPSGAPLAYDPHRVLTAPHVPFSLVTPVTARAFNALWFRRPQQDATVLSSLSAFFHPLDGVRSWNRLYGPRGFVQYQCVVPPDASGLLDVVLERVAACGGAPFLGVLKRFGEAGRGLLSFPRPGWSLAIDVPLRPGLAEVLDGLDELVAEAGGAVYLAKDARTSRELIPAMYPKLDEWRAVQAELDPQRRFQSDLDRRLELVPRA